MKLDFDAHEKKEEEEEEMKKTNGRLFIGNNNNKDRKKRKKTNLCIYCKKIIRKKNIRTWFSFYSKSILAVSSSLKSLNTSSSDSFLFV
jgi:hypothetical protein